MLRLIFLMSIFLTSCSWMNANKEHQEHFKGISNGGLTLDKPYVTQGKKAHIIGLQDASFPDMGGHNPGEMIGVWTHPIKLADGFWVKVTDQTNNEHAFLTAQEMIASPHINKFIYEPILSGIDIIGKQFASDDTSGVVISYEVENNSNYERSIILDFHLNTEISPVWFASDGGIVDSSDKVVWDIDRSVFIANDSLNPWSMVWGADLFSTSYKIDDVKVIPTQGKGVGTMQSVRLRLEEGEKVTINYVIASSLNNVDEAVERYNYLHANIDSQIATKKNDILNMLANSALTIPDKELQRAYDWVRINTRWLEMDVENLGYFLSAGAIEYSWLFGCDNSYALQGLLCTGQFELVKSTLRLLAEVSERTNGNGRIIHEMNTMGNVYNKGNTQETAHYIVAAWQAYEWTGDIDFLKELYPTIKKGIVWLTETCDANGNLYPEGNGIMEVRGLHAELIDVAVYTQQALEAVAKMAEIFNDDELSKKYEMQSVIMRDKINSDFWSETEISYCDFLGTREQAIHVTKEAIEFAKERELYNLSDVITFYNSILNSYSMPDHSADSKGRFTNKNWVVTTPMEMMITPKERALVALEQIRVNNCGEYGPYLSAIERRHMMTISTGVQAVAESNYGRVDYAVDYMKRIAQTLSVNMPGAINEMMPDYGCPVQAWTIYGLSVPLITNIVGVKPSAYNKEIVIKPQLPTGWDDVKVTDLKVGNAIISFELQKTENGIEYTLLSDDIDWSVKLIPIGHFKKVSLSSNKSLFVPN